MAKPSTMNAPGAKMNTSEPYSSGYTVMPKIVPTPSSSRTLPISVSAAVKPKPMPMPSHSYDTMPLREA